MGPIFDFNKSVSSLEKHPHWKSVQTTITTLNQKHFKALVAGGAVRDMLLGVVPKDIDIATDATPDAVEALFAKTVTVGKVFGVVKVILDGAEIEVTTFRMDGPYADGRKPDFVQFSSEKEDALRRDFTINGMFYDIGSKKVIDFVEGQKDLQMKTIRTIGDPDQRFMEDKLRILRAVRFHGQLGFAIEAETAEAIRKNSILIHQVSMERIRDEWEKILGSKNPLQAIQKTQELGLWKPLFKDWEIRRDEYARHWSLPSLDADKNWILWFLIHNIADEEKLAKEALHWKLSKKLIQKMLYCMKGIRQFQDIQDIEPVEFAIYLGKPNSRLAVEIYEQLYQAKIPDVFFAQLREAQTYFINGELPVLLITGDDLVRTGMKPGPAIAKELARLYRIQLKKKIGSKQELLKFSTN